MSVEDNEEVKVINGHDGYSINFQWSEDKKSLGIKREDVDKFKYSGSLEGPKGEKGDKGTDGFCWRPKVESNGDLTWTNDNSTTMPEKINIKGPQGIQGIQGAKGNTGATGAKGDKGDIGICWRPAIDSNGNVSWTSSTVTTAPQTVNVRGPQGVQGAKGATGAVGPAGKDGTRIIVSSTQPASISSGSIWIQVI